MVRLSLLGVLLLCCVVPLHAQTGCSVQDQQRAASAVAQIRQRLRSIPSPDMDTDVPADVQTQLPLLKEALVRAVLAVIACHDTTTSPEAMQAEIVRLLGANLPGPPEGAVISKDDHRYDEVLGGYGANVRVLVTRLSQSPLLLSVQLGFNVECGEDTLLLVLEAEGTRWVQKLRWQAAPYASVGKAFGDFFQYVLVPGTNSSEWKVAVASGTPWCTSRWSGFKMDLLEPTATGEARSLWHEEDGYVRESDPRMMVKPDGFELRLDVGTIETVQMTRKGIFRYTVKGDQVQRIEPIAVDGRGFVDAWLQAPWSDARRWSVTPVPGSLASAHQTFTEMRKSGKITYDYGPVRACSKKGRYQVEIDSDPGQPQFFSIEEGQNGYRMAGVSRQADTSCSGPDLMKGQ